MLFKKIPVCVWINHKAAINNTPIKNAAKAIPITVPDSNPSTTKLCLSILSSCFSVLFSSVLLTLTVICKINLLKPPSPVLQNFTRNSMVPVITRLFKLPSPSPVLQTLSILLIIHYKDINVLGIYSY